MMNPPEILKNFMNMMKEEQKKKFLKTAEILQQNPTDGIDYVTPITKFVEGNLWVDDFRRKAHSSEGRPFLTLCHLDPWFNNMLFNYGSNTKECPEQVLLLDFQLSGITNPGNDLAYFLLTSTTPEFRAEHLDSVLKGYFETLHRVIRESGIDDFSYSFTELLDDYQVSLNAGPMLVLFALPMMLNLDPEDAIDFGGVDLEDESMKKEFEKLNNANYEDLLMKHPFLLNRIRGVCDEIIKAKIIWAEFCFVILKIWQK